MNHHYAAAALGLIGSGLALAGCWTTTTSKEPARTTLEASAPDLMGACPESPQLSILFKHAFFGHEGGEEEQEAVVRWYLQERIVPDEVDTIFTVEQRETYEHISRPISRELALANGASASEDPIWVYAAPDTPPCKATPGAHWGHRTGHGQLFTSLTREVTLDCGEGLNDPNVGWAFGFRQAEAPSRCLWSGAAEPIAQLAQARAQGFPKEIDDALNPSSCAAPGCDLRFILNTWASRPEMGVFEVTISHVFPVEEVDECDWQFVDHYGIFVRAGQDPSTPMILWEGAEGYEGMLYDMRGVRALITQEDGVVEVAAPPEQANTQPRPLQSFRWYIPHEEDHAIHSLAPYCGP